MSVFELERRNQPDEVKRSLSLSSAPLHDGSPSLTQLHRDVGNQAVQELLRSGHIQPKLAISNPDDPEEREADNIASTIMRKAAGAPCSCSPGEEMCEECQQNQSAPAISRSASAPAAPSQVPRIVSDVLRSPGHPLDSVTRAFFEPRFGRDFSNVRVHTDSHAADSARSINAHAYTAGSDIVFAPRQYSPDSGEGKRLIAHELTHVVQQSGGAAAIQREAATDRVRAALAKVSPVAGVGDQREAYDILRDLPTNELFLTVGELEAAYELDNLYWYIGACTSDCDRIEAVMLAVLYKRRSALSARQVARAGQVIARLDPRDQGAIQGYVGPDQFAAFTGQGPKQRNDFEVRVGLDNFLVSFELWPGSMEGQGEVRVLVSPVEVSQAFQSETRYWDWRGRPVGKDDSWTSMGSWSVPAVPFTQSIPILNATGWYPIQLPENTQPGQTIWNFDWNGDGKPDFSVEVKWKVSNISREYDLVTSDGNPLKTFAYHFIQPDAWKYGYQGNLAPQRKPDDAFDLLEDFFEFGVALIPVVGELVMLAEAITGRTMFGRRMSSGERAINAIAALLPVAGGIIAKGFAKEGVKLAELAARMGRSEEEALALLQSIEARAGGEAKDIAKWRATLDAGGKLSADELIQVRSLVQQLDVDSRVFRAAEQKFGVEGVLRGGGKVEATGPISLKRLRVTLGKAGVSPSPYLLRKATKADLEALAKAGSDPSTVFAWVSRDGTGAVIKDLKGRPIINFTPTGLSSLEEAVKSFGHEVQHIKDFTVGRGTSEAVAEQAGEELWNLVKSSRER